ncbi:MAG: hypothetical protein ACOVOV_00745 [Dolichospermum sp.]
MPANTAPIFSIAGDIEWGATALTTQNTAKDGTGTVLNVFTADSNGAFVQRIRFRAAGTNIATVARIFINNGSANSTPANNILYDEITLAATTLSEVAALPTYELPLNFALPAGYKINVTLGTTVAAGYYVTVIGGKY